jgi:hypothetical protein
LEQLLEEYAAEVARLKLENARLSARLAEHPAGA